MIPQSCVDGVDSVDGDSGSSNFTETQAARWTGCDCTPKGVQNRDSLIGLTPALKL